MKLIELAEEIEWRERYNLKELDVQLGRFTVKLEGVIVQLKGAGCAIGRSMQRNWKGHLVKWKEHAVFLKELTVQLEGGY